MASKRDSGSDSYMSFDSKERQPWSMRQSTKSTTSSEIDSQEPSYRKVEVYVKESEVTVQRGLQSSNELLHYFHDLTSDMKDDITIYPETVRYSRSELQGNIIKKIKSLELGGSVFVYFSSCLPVTVNANHSFCTSVRSHLLCDVCVFSEKLPPLILSFMKTKEPKLEGYSIELGKIMNEILRKNVHNVSVASGSIEMDVERDKGEFSTKIKEIVNSSYKFGLSQWSKNREICRDLIIRFLTAIATSAAYSLFESEHAISMSTSECLLTKREFELIVNSTDGPWMTLTQLDVSSSTLFLMTEMACRLSKRGRTLLEITPCSILFEKLKNLNIPFLEVVRRASRKESSMRYVQVLTMSPDCIYKESDADIWLFWTNSSQEHTSQSADLGKLLPVRDVHTLPRDKRRRQMKLI